MSSTVVFTPDHLEQVVERCGNAGAFVFDVEAWGPNRGIPTKAQLCWMGIATDGLAVAVPFGHPNGYTEVARAHRKKNAATKKMDLIPAKFSPPPEQMTPSQVFEILRPLFWDESIVKVAHNFTYDGIATAKYFGEIIPPEYSDTIVLQWLLDENMKQKGLKELVRRYYGVDYDKENVGKFIEGYTFGKVAHYTYMDAKYEWLLYKRLRQQITDEGLEGVYALEMDVLGVLLEMGIEGAPVDVEALQTLEATLSERLVEIEARVYQSAGKIFNINSVTQKANLLYGVKTEGGQGLKPYKPTDGGRKKIEAKMTLDPTDYSTDADSLEMHPKNPLAKTLLEYQVVNKLLGTYVQGYLGVDGDPKKPCQIFDDRIHADFVQYGTVTGRFSCLAGSTLLETSRGAFTIAEYVPQRGDLIRTHKDRWMPVVRKFDQGERDVYRVTLSNGFSLQCTQDHLLMTPVGWKQAGDLVPGEKVCVDDSVRSPDAKSGERPEDSGHLSFRGQTDDEGHGHPVRVLVSDGESHHSSAHAPRGTAAREGASLLTLEGRVFEPDAGQVRGAAPQLSGRRLECGRLPATEGGASVCVGASAGHGRGAGSGQVVGAVRRASHRQEQTEQRPGQLGVGDKRGSRETTWGEISVREVAFVAPMGVWDIEVEGDHSFVTQGFIVHNCRAPNLQNIPTPGTELGKQIRGLWVAPEGQSLIVADYGQIELVVLAHYLGRGNLFDGFFDGIDPHTMTAAGVLGKDPKDVTPSERSLYGKSINFAVVYGAGAAKVAAMSESTERQAKQFLAAHEREFPEIYAFKDAVIQRAKSRRPAHITTLLGRKRRLPTLFSSDRGLRAYAERQAVNSLIQGSSADLIKLAMVRVGNIAPDWFRLILTVHDELVALIPEDKGVEAKAIMTEAMLGEGITSLVRVPMKSDIKVVKRWSEAK